jgi:hypothetical protein
MAMQSGGFGSRIRGVSTVLLATTLAGCGRGGADQPSPKPAPVSRLKVSEEAAKYEAMKLTNARGAVGRGAARPTPRGR